MDEATILYQGWQYHYQWHICIDRLPLLMRSALLYQYKDKHLALHNIEAADKNNFSNNDNENMSYMNAPIEKMQS